MAETVAKTATPIGTVAPVAAPRRSPILALLAGNIVSLVGSSLTAIALPWFVLQTTGSAAKTGLVGFFGLLPALIAGVFGGVLVDRLGYKRVSVASDVVSLVGVALVPLLYDTVGLAFWQLLMLVFVARLLNLPGLTARRALLPELAQLAHWRLERINASFESVNALAMLLGPPLAGLLVAVMGANNVLWLDAASFAVSAALVAGAIPAVAVTPQVIGRYGEALMSGLRFLWHDRLLRAMAATLALSNFLGASLFAVLLPVFVKETYGQATVLGLIFSASGLGQLLGAVAYGAFGPRVPRRVIWLVGFSLMPLGYWMLGVGVPLVVLVVTLAVTGFFTGPINPLMVTIRHEHIPPELRGRVFSTYSAVASGAQPLGLLLGGLAVQGTGVRATALIFALAAQAVGIGMFFVPALRAMRTPPSTPEQLNRQYSPEGARKTPRKANTRIH